MNPSPHTVTVWQSGRLAPHVAAHRFDFGRQHWLGAALLVLSAVVLTLFVAVLEKDVGRNAMQHEAQHSRAVAEAQCESDQPAELRGRCVALFNGGVVAATAAREVTPANTAYEQDNGARATTVSLMTTPR